MFNFFLTAPFDYTSVDADVVIPAGETEICVSINITDDNALEGDQDYLLVVSSTDPGVILGNFVTSVIITDNDGM